MYKIFISLVNNLGKKDIKYLSHEFDRKVLDFKGQLPSKEMFYILLTDNKLVIKIMCMFLRFLIDLK